MGNRVGHSRTDSSIWTATLPEIAKGLTLPTVWPVIWATSATIEKLADFPLTIIASPALEQQCCDFVSPGQHKNVCFITNDRDGVYQSIFDQYASKRAIVMESMMNLGSIESIKQCVASNLRVSFLPRYVVEKELEQKELQEIVTELSDQTITAVCTYHKNKWVTPAMELFIRLARQIIV